MDKIFFIGIGGSGMSRLALLYRSLGHEVEGSDIKESEYTELLKEHSIKVLIGHSSEHIDKSFSAVVYSSAIKNTNPELLKAKTLGLKTLKRGEALASVVNKFSNIIVSGTHGKTTTTSLVGHILKEHGIRVNVYIGGNDEEFDNFHKDPEYFVVESDESDGSFLLFNPNYLIITNIDRDHLNHYNGDFNELKDAFSELLKKSGTSIVCGADKNAREVAAQYEDKTLFYGTENFKAENVNYLPYGTEFDLISDKGEKRIKVFSPLFGEKNIFNALAALLVSETIGIPLKSAVGYLKTFKSPARRMEIKKDNGFLLIDDHADHPTEIEATLTAIKKHFPGKRIIAVFQPHRYSRMKSLGKNVALPFCLADVIIVTEIFSAFEEPISGVTGKNIANYIRERYTNKDVYFTSSVDDAARLVNSILKKDDIVVLLGPGDIGKLSDLIGLKGEV